MTVLSTNVIRGRSVFGRIALIETKCYKRTVDRAQKIPIRCCAGPFHFAMEDNKKLKTQLLRNLVIDEIQCYHPTIDFQRIWAAQAAKDKIDAQLHEEKERSAARLKALQNSELSLFGREDIMQNGQPVLYESQNIPSTDLKI